MIKKLKENIFYKFIYKNILISGFLVLLFGLLFSMWLNNIFNFNITQISDTDHFKYFLNFLLAI